MSNQLKVSARPPIRKNDDILEMQKIKDLFVKEGDVLEQNLKQQTEKVEEKPWDNARKDVFKIFNIRLPEDYFVKLDFLSQKIRKSKHSICLDVIKSEIDDLIDEVEKGDYKIF